jgi:hypothetical protein
VAGDVAGHLGCFISLKDSINAITLVTIGTSVPDTFASKLLAVQVCYNTYYSNSVFLNLFPYAEPFCQKKMFAEPLCCQKLFGGTPSEKKPLKAVST